MLNRLLDRLPPAGWRIAHLVLKELLAVWRDPKGRMSLIVPPIMQLLVFAFAATQEVKNVPLGVFNLDQGKAAQELLIELEHTSAFSELVMVNNEQAMRELIDGQHALAVVRIGEDYSRKIERGETASVQLILDGRRSNAAQILQGYLVSIVTRLNQQLLQQRQHIDMPSLIVERTWFNPNREAQTSIVPALMGMLTLTTALMVTSLSIARERELGTFEQLLVSPLQPLEIAIGKMAPGLLIGFAQGTLVMLVSVFLFGIQLRGSVLILYLGLLLFLLASIGIGLLISSLVSTQQQAMLGTMSFMMPAAILSGFSTPIQNMPDWLHPITWINPLAHFLVIIRGVFLRDIPLTLVADRLWPLLGIALVALVGAAWFFKHKIE